MTEGEVLVDDVNVKDYEQESLHNLIGYVPQKAVIFKGTIKSNVAYGEDGKGKKSEEKIKEAIKVAQAKEFVNKMPKKYDTQISQGGTNISGGQKQRLSIARAVARDPEIYIFDDTFSALDFKTDAKLRINSRTKNRHNNACRQNNRFRRWKMCGNGDTQRTIKKLQSIQADSFITIIGR